MTSDDLSPDQLRKLAATSGEFRDYLVRLRTRMDSLRFDTSDPLYSAALAAWQAVSNLTVVAASSASRRAATPPAREEAHGWGQ